MRHLPDPPLPGFDSDKINLSGTAFIFGVQDGPLSLASFVANITLALWGSAYRARNGATHLVDRSFQSDCGGNWYFKPFAFQGRVRELRQPQSPA
ncbi:MAG: hypothetical protein ACRD7E_21135 [Bryobacteraceae bacterium]